MKSHKPIGFHIPDIVPEEKPDSNTGTQLTDIIKMLYKANGFTEEKDFKSAAEIAYELSDTIIVTTRKVSEVMTSLGFEVTTIENQVCFIVYTPEN